MTPERAKELLPIITAFAEGKKIEFLCGEYSAEGWTYTPDPKWVERTQYRVAPEPKKKVKMWKALIKSMDLYVESSEFFRSELEVFRYYPVSFVRFLPHTEIEVEVDDE